MIHTCQQCKKDFEYVPKTLMAPKKLFCLICTDLRRKANMRGHRKRQLVGKKQFGFEINAALAIRFMDHCHSKGISMKDMVTSFITEYMKDK